jgi:phosphate transport system permease protein
MSLSTRRRMSRQFAWLCGAAAFLGVALLAILLIDLVWQGIPSLNFKFLTQFPSRFPDQAGIKAALWGSIWLVGLTAVISIPIGIGGAIYLEEFARKNRFTRFIQLNISNLAGVPSIVYGMLGLVAFVRLMKLERSVLSGALTMSLLILPTIIVASQEALRAIPNTMRYAAFALGGTRWQTVRDHVLPAALPGVLTGIILSLSRAIGETAPLIMTGALTYVAFVPSGPMDAFSALPIQIFNWTSRPQHAFHSLAAAGILVLLIVLLVMNSVAIALRFRFQKRQQW